MSDYANALVPGGAYQEKGFSQCRPSTHREMLIQKKAELEDKLDRVNDALNQLDKHPDFEEVMNAVVKATY